MIKLLLCLAVAAVTAACLMQLRQQRMELNHQSAQLHNQIESQHARLWNQQIQIAKLTSPPALRDSIGRHDLQLTPLTPPGQASATLSAAAR